MALTLFQIPLQNIPQRFEIALGTVTYTVENRWNSIAGYWELDWYDATGLPLVMGMALLGGVDLLDPYPQLGGNTAALVVLTAGADNGATPTLDGLGVDSQLYYLTNG